MRKFIPFIFFLHLNTHALDLKNNLLGCLDPILENELIEKINEVRLKTQFNLQFNSFEEGFSYLQCNHFLLQVKLKATISSEVMAKYAFEGDSARVKLPALPHYKNFLQTLGKIDAEESGCNHQIKSGSLKKGVNGFQVSLDDLLRLTDYGYNHVKFLIELSDIDVLKNDYLDSVSYPAEKICYQLKQYVLGVDSTRTEFAQFFFDVTPMGPVQSHWQAANSQVQLVYSTYFSNLNKVKGKKVL